MFGQTKVGYLGHFISSEGLAVDHAKIDAIQHWPNPQMVKDVQGFLGLVGYYRRFIKNYASIARPLTNLLRKYTYC